MIQVKNIIILKNGAYRINGKWEDVESDQSAEDFKKETIRLLKEAIFTDPIIMEDETGDIVIVHPDNILFRYAQVREVEA